MNIPTREWRDVYDKRDWGAGIWQHEPDKRQWQDEVTGLACLIVRSPVTGSLCGYIGVNPEHPAHGLHYDGITADEAEALRKAFQENTKAWARAGYPDLLKWSAEHRLPARPDPVPGIGERIYGIRVHGGLIYASRNRTVIDRVKWMGFYSRWPELEEKVQRFPRGDAAHALVEWGRGFKDYEWWVDRMLAVSICAVGEDGQVLDLWWYGFDCGHAGDLSPKIGAVMREEMMRGRFPMPPLPADFEEVYRDWAYVEGEVEALANQFADLMREVWHAGADTTGSRPG